MSASWDVVGTAQHGVGLLYRVTGYACDSAVQTLRKRYGVPYAATLAPGRAA